MALHPFDKLTVKSNISFLFTPCPGIKDANLVDSVSQLKAATEVQDVKSAIDFNLSQVSAMTQLSQQMIEDGQKLTKLGQEFKDNLEALTKEQMQTAQV